MKCVAAAFCVLAGSAAAADVRFDGYADLRLIVPSKSGSYYYGDLGKLRFGYDDGRTAVKLTDVVGQGTVLVTPELMATATGRIDPYYGPALDLIEAFVRYRPVSTTVWRWSVKAGAFFPPVSLENDQIGWQSAWTITPSAINTWVGYELRTIGAEGTLEWRREGGNLALSGAVYGWNDPTGVLLADRGWSLDDRVSGLFERERIPDAVQHVTHQPVPILTRVFREIDNRPGWYLNLTWQPANGTFALMRYDNEADPSTRDHEGFAWRTQFWQVAYRGNFGNLTVLAQAMTGSTDVHPSQSRVTNFSAAYLLAGLDLDPWRLAARVDLFRTHTPALPFNSENGAAATVATSWWARSWLQFTAEGVVVDSNRAQRTLVGDAAHVTEVQFQLLARLYV